MWALRLFTWFFKLIFGFEVWKIAEKAHGVIMGLSATVLMRTKPDLMTAAVKEVNEEVLKFNPIAVKLSAETLKQIAGLEVNAAELESVIKAPPGRNATIAVGDAFLPILNGIFDIPAAAADFQTRTGFAGSAANMSAFFGTNLTFQLRSLTISTISSMFGFHSLRHLEGLHQTINWAFGFGWLSWAVMSNIMDVAVNPGIKRLYLSQVKPHDMTEAQGIRAHVEGLFPHSELMKLMDNQGLRDDVRDTLITMAQKDYSESQAAHAYLQGRISTGVFTEAMNRQAVVPGIRQTLVDMAEQNLSGADLKCLWKNGTISETEMVQFLRWDGYGAHRAKLKASVLMHECKGEKRDREVEALRRLYRDCVIGEIEFRSEMDSRHTASDEQDHQVTLALIERRQRTFLGNADLAKAAALGLRTVPEITDTLVCRGYTQDDALTEVILRLASLLPSCEGKALKEAELVPILQALAQTLGANQTGISAAVLAFLSCFPLGGPLAAPIINKFTATPDKVSFKGVALIEWEVTGADTVTITHIGSVESKGSTLYQFKEPVGFLLIATNSFGKRTEEVLVSILPDEEAPPPPVLASFSPTSGPAGGGTVVTLTGSGFTGATGVTFNYLPGTHFTVDSDTQITVTTPAGTGEAQVVVVGAGGVSVPLPDQTFHFQPASETVLVSSIVPTGGPKEGGTTVLITGSGFTGATGVNFGYAPGVGMQVDSDSQITVTTPPATGTVDVRVVTPSGNSATGQARIFHFF